MKIALLLISNLLFLSDIIGQTIKVNSNVGDLAYNGIVVSQNTRLSSKSPCFFAVAFKENYVTKGISVQEVNQKEISQYTINLEEIVKPNINKVSKRLKFTSIKIKDCFILNGVPTVNTLSGKDLDESKYIAPLKTAMSSWSYNVMGLNSFATFEEKGENPDLLIGGEIINLAYGTRGTGGFKISLLIKWSIYDVSKKAIIYNVATAGYSHSGLGQSDELVQTLKDGLIGLMTDKEFIELCNSTEK